MKKKCIFLDRDGTINVYKELLHNVEDMKLIKGSAKAIELINKSGYLCIVVSNQSVVARNLCTMGDVIRINKRMEELLAKKNAYLDNIFICPHHPDKGYPEENKKYKIKCNCRKPNIGLIKKAQKKYNIDLNNSYMIGDTTIDIKTGQNAGIKTILVKTGLAGMDSTYNVRPDYISENLYDAVKLILF
ncbi:HAD family hydrolase [Clostridium sp. cel8]|uniref:D-glycero-alpha-D-manno-heptose-1,7-bisphosphate 7-phosphatase n=1 Tax=Clostridium sp. cel8 TaxID=2663123 RepID=UPI0015F518FD|nr:HAD family hydrolase [Clostridium sp. cel8]MBA5851071.1 HAD family hydrolase [Clostridium sp. cel8]